MKGVAAAQGHQSVSDRSIDKRQLAGRPVERYVRELETAKKSASAVQPAQTVNHARARLISLFLESGDAVFRELVLRILHERLLVMLQRLGLVNGLEQRSKLRLDR